MIRIRNGRPISAVSVASRNELIESFEKQNDKLVELIEADSAARHADAVERAVLLIVLLSVAFAGVGGLLLSRMRQRETQRRLATRSTTRPSASSPRPSR